jgi:hypothetical protein
MAAAMFVAGSANSAAAAVPTNGTFPVENHTVAACANAFGAPRSGGRTHAGNDCFANVGVPLLAVESGVIEQIDNFDTHTCGSSSGDLGGITVWLKGDSGTSYYYAHNSRNLVQSVGARVVQGQRIAAVGKSGNACRTAAHVHFEIHPGGKASPPVDPYPYLTKWRPGTFSVDPYFRGLAATATSGGYWLLGRDGGVFSYGSATYAGSMGGRHLNAETVAMAADPDGQGYWLVAADGGIFAFDAPYLGSMGGQHLNKPIVGMAATKTGRGYWLVASDGGMFAFGDAGFAGSMGGRHLNSPVVGMAADPDGAGYWLVASDGGIFSFDAPFLGSMGGQRINRPIVGMASRPGHHGYWLTAQDGGVFSFGNVGFHGSMGGQPLNQPVRSIAADPDGAGYWLIAGDGGVFSFDAPFHGRGPSDL